MENIYERFTLYKKNNQDEINKQLKEMRSTNEFSKKMSELGMFISSCAKDDIIHEYLDSWDINHSIMIHFPVSFQLEMIQNFIDAGESQHGYYVESLKLIYLYWNKYGNLKYKDKPSHYPSSQFFEQIYILRYIMREFANDKYNPQFGYNRAYTSYVLWHMLGLYPLLENGKDIIMNKLISLPYNDAQDSLMFGLYQLDPNKFKNELKQILLFWDDDNSPGRCVQFCSSTGMLSQLQMIFTKYKAHGIDVENDEVFGMIIKKYDMGKYN